jgi:hypothetical protein
VRELRLLNAVRYTLSEGCADRAARESPDDWADGVAGEFPAACVAGTLAAARADVTASGLAGTLEDEGDPSWALQPRRAKPRSADPARSRR